MRYLLQVHIGPMSQFLKYEKTFFWVSGVVCDGGGAQRKKKFVRCPLCPEIGQNRVNMAVFSHFCVH